jgi:hypothetical protein
MDMNLNMNVNKNMDTSVNMYMNVNKNMGTSMNMYMTTIMDVLRILYMYINIYMNMYLNMNMYFVKSIHIKIDVNRDENTYVLCTFFTHEQADAYFPAHVSKHGNIQVPGQTWT